MRSWPVVSLALACLAAAGCCKSKSDESSASPPATTPAQPEKTVAAPTTPPTPTPPPAPVELYRVGEHIQVSWKGTCYPARILKVVRPGSYYITYTGYDHSWDETITKARICSPKR